MGGIDSRAVVRGEIRRGIDRYERMKGEVR